MSNLRIIGDNISLEMKRLNMNVAQLAQLSGIAVEDLKRILEGRLVVFSEVLEKVAKALGVSIDDIVQERGKEEYNDLMHCMGSFRNIDNRDIILDYIDFYIGIQEAK